MKKRRTKITIEQENVLVIGRTLAVESWCSACGAQVTMIQAGEAAAVAGAKTRAIYRDLEAGKFHFKETPDGTLLICLSSLMRHHQA